MTSNTPEGAEGGTDTAKTHVVSGPLATHLKAMGATTNQVSKFLATAIWLHDKGTAKLSTSDVTKALKDSSQSRLTNPAECLNKNVAKGYCEKDGKQFYVTEEGRNSKATAAS
jgi:hypothetical protein